MTFEADISRFIKKAGSNAETAVRKIGIELFRKVILKTPVDKGRLVGNWFVSLNVPSTEYSENALDPSRSRAQRDGTAQIIRYKIGDRAIYLTNNTPYAMRIETTGYSKVKAPQGMARISVMEIASKYR